jgi:hypothetical protein
MRILRGHTDLGQRAGMSPEDVRAPRSLPATANTISIEMLFFLYVAARLAAFAFVFVCLGLAISRAGSEESGKSLPLFMWAVVFLALSAFLAVI